ncbi:MAG: hypothetical protein J7J94_02445 [Thaumarchaeota archaeon]|nr:hypothetical protein [Nitrososphaerota archaeon]
MAGGAKKTKRQKAKNKSVDEKLFREAVKTAVKQPRLAFYSPVASCVLNYWKSVVPRFSISEFLAEVVERELAKAWPQLYKKSLKEVEKRFKSKRRRVVVKSGGSRRSKASE